MRARAIDAQVGGAGVDGPDGAGGILERRLVWVARCVAIFQNEAGDADRYSAMGRPSWPAR